MKRDVLHYLTLFGLSMLAFLALGVVACLVPDEPVKEHVYQSVHLGDLTSDYPLAILNRKQCQMDNFTDALIMNQAYRMSKDSLFVSVLAPTRATGGLASVDVLRMMTEGVEGKSDNYARYWNGSTFLTRILLLLGDYSRIRVILYIISTLLMTGACLAIYRQAGPLPMMALLLALLGVNVYVMQFSIQYFPVLAITLVAVWWLFSGDFTASKASITLFISGMLTSYFDLFTAPLMTLGIPLCYVVWQTCKKDTPIKGCLIAVQVSLLWVVGYAGAWAFKWLLATLFLPGNTFSDAWSQAQMRANDIEDFSRFDAIWNNYNMVSTTFILAVVLAVAVLAAIRFRRDGIWCSILLLCVAVTPYIWYLIVANHSILHNWYTYRAQAVTLLGVMLAGLSVTDLDRLPFRRRHNNTSS